MFDASIRPIIDLPLNQLARGCVAVGLTANGLTIFGFIFGIFCAVFISMGFFSGCAHLPVIEPSL